MQKRVRRIIFTILIVAAVIVGFNTYTADYYHAKDYELQTTEVSETDAYIAYGDPQSETGLIFYPRTKVERERRTHRLWIELAQQESCVTVKMPAHLTILSQMRRMRCSRSLKGKSTGIWRDILWAEPWALCGKA